mgnify:CR=1 FL=1
MEKSLISLCLLSGLSIGNSFAQTPSKPNILLGCLYVNKIMYRLIHTIANGENNGMLPDNNHYLMLYSDINAFCSFFSSLWL